MVDPDMCALVIDLGSFMTKCGFGGDDAPRAVFPSIDGVHNSDEALESKDILERKKRSVLEEYSTGSIVSRDDMEKILNHTFLNELQVSPEEHPTLITEPPLCPVSNRETIASIIFESFDVPALYLSVQGVLSTYASGKMTGLVLDSGYCVSHIVPVYEGYAMEHAVLQNNLAGKDVTDYLVKILSKRGYEMTTSAEREIVRDIKEKLAYVARNYEAEVTKAEFEYEYELPDGSKITIGSERFRAPGIMFKPSVIGSELSGIHQTMLKSMYRLRENFLFGLVEAYWSH